MPPGGESLAGASASEAGNEGARGAGGGGAVSRTPGSGKGKEKAASGGGGGGGDGYVVVFMCVWDLVVFQGKGNKCERTVQGKIQKKRATPILMSIFASPSHYLPLSLRPPNQSYSAHYPPAPKPFVSVLSLPVHEGFVAWLASPDR